MIIDPILITGCARSGTSLTTGIINLCGAFGGDLSGPNPNNKKGMFENHAIRNGVVKPYLRSLGVDQMGQKPLPNQHQLYNITKKQANQWRDKLLTVIKREGYTVGSWFYKGAKIVLIWYLWHTAFPQAKWIIVRRKKEDIISSCLRTGFMRAYNSPEGWAEWVEHHERLFVSMQKFSVMRDNVFEVWPERIIKGDLTYAKVMIDWLGLDWNEEGVSDFISPKLWKGGK